MDEFNYDNCSEKCDTDGINYKKINNQSKK